MHNKVAVSLLIAFICTPLATKSQNLKAEFKFDQVSDVSGTYTGALKNGATLSSVGNIPILDLGKTNGYFDLGSTFGSLISGLTDYSIAVNLYIPTTTNISGNGNFVWCFANSSTTGYTFFGAKDSRCAITLGTWSGEQNVSAAQAFPKGTWTNVVYTQSGGTGSLYIGGTLKTSQSISLTPSNLNATVLNYLGKSCYSSDAYLVGACYNDFRIYDGALTAETVSAMTSETETLNNAFAEEEIKKTIATFTIGDVSALTDNIKLPISYNGTINITWTTSDSNVITDKGVITRPAAGSEKATAVLTAHLSCGNVVEEKTFNVGVLPQFSDDEALQLDKDSLTIAGNLNNVYTDLTLPSVAKYGSVVEWQSNNESYMTSEGHVVKFGETSKAPVTLTATLRRGTKSTTKQFDIKIHQAEPYSNYMFVFFPSNSNENIYYALSNDGYNYTVLNDGNRVISADSVSVMKGLRDPHILRGNDGYFYMVITDMKSSLGWSSNRGIVMMRSKDLINWSHSTVHFPTRFAGTTFANVSRVWAPETIWDPNYINGDGSKGRYMIYFSILTTDGKVPYDKDYYCYANDDFTDLIGTPTYLYDRGSATIDMDIVYNEDDSLYHAFYKNEGSGGICQVTAKTLTAAEGQAAGSQWSQPSGTLQQTNVAVEGVGVFKLINKDSWIMMYDCYTSGYYQFCSSNDLENFTFVKNTTTSGAFTPRHGTVIQLTSAETEALLKAFPTSGITPTAVGARNINIKQDNLVIGTSNITIPVDRSTDISNFDPQLYGTTGTVVSPDGAQDFSKGTIDYTFTSTGGTKHYTVSVEADGNPIISGFHADPEVLFSKKTGQFYVYPTTDGYSGWGGYSFDVFSSPDLLHFTNEGTILNLQSGGDVAWASGNAWAPCIEEKWMNGDWRYFFYFSGNNTSLNKKTIGVATANSPTGPFIATDTPLFTTSSAGQMIDGDVFTDPVTQKSYLYYGNGKMCYRMLNDDMTSVTGSEYVITPVGGTLSDYAFREGTYVFYRNGIYYFLWSVDDTGSKNYHVAYGTSKSPTGPITVAAKPIVICQDATNGIYGTGHNSVVNLPGTDEWYIVYHRINNAYLNNGPGYHREVCCDRLTFNVDGSINQVTPTNRGIDPVNAKAIADSLITSIAPITYDSTTKTATIRYYRIDGSLLGKEAPSQHGVYFREELLNNGTRRTVKIMR